MINPKTLIKMARKGQRKRISFPRSRGGDRGHFVVYTADGKRFAFPIAYLNNSIFRDLFKMSEEEFGLPSDGPITLPCDAVFMDYAVSLIQRRATEEIEKALLMSMANRGSLSCSQQEGDQTEQQLLVCGF